MASRPNLSVSERAAPFLGELGKMFPVIMSPGQLAALCGKSRKTIYAWIEAGRLDGCFRKRGKHCLIWRDRALKILFDGPTWGK